MATRRLPPPRNTYSPVYGTEPLPPLATRRFTSDEFADQLDVNLRNDPRRMRTTDPDTDTEPNSVDWNEIADLVNQVRNSRQTQAGPDISEFEGMSTELKPEPPALWERGLKALTDPLSGGAIGRAARRVTAVPDREWIKSTGKGDIQDWAAWLEASIKGAHRGGIEGLADLADEFTSPADLAGLALTGGAYTGARRGWKGVQAMRRAARLTGVPIATRGGAEMYEAGTDMAEQGLTRENAKQFGAGALQGAFGAAQMHFPASSLPARNVPRARPRITVPAGTSPAGPPPPSGLGGATPSGFDTPLRSQGPEPDFAGEVDIRDVRNKAGKLMPGVQEMRPIRGAEGGFADDARVNLRGFMDDPISAARRAPSSEADVDAINQAVEQAMNPTPPPEQIDPNFRGGEGDPELAGSQPYEPTPTLEELVRELPDMGVRSIIDNPDATPVQRAAAQAELSQRQMNPDNEMDVVRAREAEAPIPPAEMKQPGYLENLFGVRELPQSRLNLGVQEAPAPRSQAPVQAQAQVDSKTRFNELRAKDSLTPAEDIEYDQLLDILNPAQESKSAAEFARSLATSEKGEIDFGSLFNRRERQKAIAEKPPVIEEGPAGDVELIGRERPPFNQYDSPEASQARIDQPELTMMDDSPEASQERINTYARSQGIDPTQPSRRGLLRDEAGAGPGQRKPDPRLEGIPGETYKQFVERQGVKWEQFKKMPDATQQNAVKAYQRSQAALKAAQRDPTIAAAQAEKLPEPAADVVLERPAAIGVDVPIEAEALPPPRLVPKGGKPKATIPAAVEPTAPVQAGAPADVSNLPFPSTKSRRLTAEDLKIQRLTEEANLAAARERAEAISAGQQELSPDELFAIREQMATEAEAAAQARRSERQTIEEFEFSGPEREGVEPLRAKDYVPTKKEATKAPKRHSQRWGGMGDFSVPGPKSKADKAIESIQSDVLERLKKFMGSEEGSSPTGLHVPDWVERLRNRMGESAPAGTGEFSMDLPLQQESIPSLGDEAVSPEFGGGYGSEIPNPQARVSPTGEFPPERGPTIKTLGKEELKPGVPVREIPKRPEEIPGYFREAWNLGQSMMSIDAPYVTSAAFRQASPLAWTKNWYEAWGKASQAFGDQVIADELMAEIKNSKYFKPRYKPVMKSDGTIKAYKEIPSVNEEIGVYLSDPRSLNSREETLRGTWAEKIPGYGKYVTASNRAYSTFLNHLRRTKLEEMMDGRSWSGLENDKIIGKEIGEFVNAATGRGSLGHFEKNAQDLAMAFWSPKLIAARLKFLNPMTYVNADPLVRQEYLSGLMRTMGTWAAFAGLAKFAGADVNMDPRNADFGKIKIGNTRIDPGAGFQQLLVFGSRMASGQFGSSTTGQVTNMGEGFKPRTRLSTTQEFLASKLHPSAKVAYDLMNASQSAPVHLGDRAVQMALPMMVQDIAEVLKADPKLAAIVGPLSNIGMGTGTYGKGDEFGAPVFTDFMDETLGLDPRTLSGTLPRQQRKMFPD